MAPRMQREMGDVDIRPPFAERHDYKIMGGGLILVYFLAFKLWKYALRMMQKTVSGLTAMLGCLVLELVLLLVILFCVSKWLCSGREYRAVDGA